MGTKCLTVFTDEKEREIAVLYRQFDGYPECHGAELAEFLSEMLLVDGIPSDKPSKIANGMGCLTAQVIKHFKDGVGGFYLYPAGTRDMWEEYIYFVSGSVGGEPVIKVDCGDRQYNGPASGFGSFLKELEEE